MSNFSERLKQLRAEFGFTQKELADKVNTSKSSINMYERGEREPSLEMLKTFASLFQVDMNDLLGNLYSPPKKGVKIPVFGQVIAGIPIEAIQDILDYEEISEEMASCGEYFALQIRGDSMEPKFSEGDVVIVRRQPDVDSGDIAIVLVNGDEATIKKVRKRPDGVMLIPSNPDYEPLFYNNQQIEELPVCILGKVVELRAKF